MVQVSPMDHKFEVTNSVVPFPCLPIFTSASPQAAYIVVKSVSANTDQIVEEVWLLGQQALKQAEQQQSCAVEKLSEEIERFSARQAIMKAENARLMQIVAGLLAQFPTANAAGPAMPRFCGTDGTVSGIACDANHEASPMLTYCHHRGENIFQV
mmetsp:Transcript_97107/g.274495  ORF Transcript_97107/g.274495 Transcript_97107/m.274495 type:complete len:155 (-) Transcript_97107:161-625(-)